MLHHADFLDGDWKPAEFGGWLGWLRNCPCCFLTVPCANSLHVADGELVHKAGTLTTHFIPDSGSLSSSFSGTWYEEGCIVCLPTPLCLPAKGRGSMAGLMKDGKLDIRWWDGACKVERAVWSRDSLPVDAVRPMQTVPPKVSVEEVMPPVQAAASVPPVQTAARVPPTQLVDGAGTMKDGKLDNRCCDNACNNERAVWSRNSLPVDAVRPMQTVPPKVAMEMPPVQAAASVPPPQLVGAVPDKYLKTTSSAGGLLERMASRQASIRRKTLSARPESQSQAFVQNWGHVPHDKLMQHWGGQHKILPEYQRAHDRICLCPEWMSSTKVMTHIQMISASFPTELKAIKGDPHAFATTMISVIQRAYSLTGGDRAAMEQKDVLSQQPIFQKVSQCYGYLEEWKRPLFVHAWQRICDCEEDAGAIVSKLSEVVDRALHCPQVQAQSFQLVVSHSAQLLAGSRGHAEMIDDNDKEAGFKAALLRFYECFEDFLDDYKERAFSAAFQEPARFYLTLSGAGPGYLKDNVETHANNWYIALLNATLGVHVPIMATYWDNFPPPVCDFWAGLHDKAWESYFSQPEHFGSGWQGIPGLKRDGRALIRKRVKTGIMPDVNHHVEMSPAMQFANNAVNPNGNELDRRLLSIYLERFTSFFERDRFVRKAFETLNSECKPDHHGFRAALGALFEVYRAEEAGIDEETYIEHCYRDEMFTELDLERTSRFFAWLGILRAPGRTCDNGQDILTSSAPEKTTCDTVVQGEECPICLEQISDVQPLVHTSNVKGDMCKHRVCAVCLVQMVAKKQTCPWCRDDPVWRDICGFFDGLRSDLSAASHPDELADLMGKWQEYEMTRSWSDVCKFAVEMVQDVALCAHLDRVLKGGDKAFMRDSAGLWCRLHAMIVAEEISVLPSDARRIHRIVEGAIEAFEADGGGAPQHIGAMYTQLASALLCAVQSGSSTETLVQQVQQVGNACVRLHSSRFKNAAAVRVRLPRMFAESVSDVVWGGAQKDIILQTFFE